MVGLLPALRGLLQRKTSLAYWFFSAKFDYSKVVILACVCQVAVFMAHWNMPDRRTRKKRFPYNIVTRVRARETSAFLSASTYLFALLRELAFILAQWLFL